MQNGGRTDEANAKVANMDHGIAGTGQSIQFAMGVSLERDRPGKC